MSLDTLMFKNLNFIPQALGVELCGQSGTGNSRIKRKETITFVGLYTIMNVRFLVRCNGIPGMCLVFTANEPSSPGFAHNSCAYFLNYQVASRVGAAIRT